MKKEFKKIYDEYYTGILWHIYEKVKSLDDAEDICQEVFLVLFDTLGKEPVLEISKFIFKVTHLQIHRHYDKVKRSEKITKNAIEAHGLIEKEGHYLTIERLWEHISSEFSFDQTDKQIFIDMVFFGLTYKETCKALNITKNVVEYRLKKIIRKIDEYVKKHNIKSFKELLDE